MAQNEAVKDIVRKWSTTGCNELAVACRRQKKNGRDEERNERRKIERFNELGKEYIMTV